MQRVGVWKRDCLIDDARAPFRIMKRTDEARVHLIGIVGQDVLDLCQGVAAGTQRKVSLGHAGVIHQTKGDT